MWMNATKVLFDLLIRCEAFMFLKRLLINVYVDAFNVTFIIYALNNFVRKYFNYKIFDKLFMHYNYAMRIIRFFLFG